MEQSPLKQRLVGAVVLVALAVIFIPMLLSGGRDMEMPVFGSNVPSRPAAIKNIEVVDINAPVDTPSIPVVPARVPIENNLPEPPVAPVIEEKPKPAEKTDNTASNQVGWAVQVGSFSKRANAMALQSRLRNSNYPAFVERIMQDDKPVYRVRIGPEVKQASAEALRDKVQQDMKLKGFVVKHP